MRKLGGAKERKMSRVDGELAEAVDPSSAVVNGPERPVTVARLVPQSDASAGDGAMQGTLTALCMSVLPIGTQPHRCRIPDISIPFHSRCIT